MHINFVIYCFGFCFNSSVLSVSSVFSQLTRSLHSHWQGCKQLPAWLSSRVLSILLSVGSFRAECFPCVYQVLSSVSSASVLNPISSRPFTLPVSSPFLFHSRGPGLSWVPSPCCGLEALQARIRVLIMMPVSRLCACPLPIIRNHLKHSLHIFLKLVKAIHHSTLAFITPSWLPWLILVAAGGIIIRYCS